MAVQGRRLGMRRAGGLGWALFSLPPSWGVPGCWFLQGKEEDLVSLMYNWSVSCTQCCSTCDGSLSPLGCHRMLPPRDTAAGKAFFLGKGAVSHHLQMAKLWAVGN